MPGHYNNGNGNRTTNRSTSNKYTIIGTGQTYTGTVVHFGGKMFTTEGGGYEGTSQEVHLETTDSTINNTTRQNARMAVQSDDGAMNNQNNNPVVATFVRGDGSQFDRTYYLPLNYSGPYGTAGGPVIADTPLHRHQNRQTMLEHNMDNPVIVTTTRPTSTRRGVNTNRGQRMSTQTDTSTRRQTRTTMRQPTMRRGGTSGGGGY